MSIAHGDATLADAILDRLLHNSHKLKLKEYAGSVGNGIAIIRQKWHKMDNRYGHAITAEDDCDADPHDDLYFREGEVTIINCTFEPGPLSPG